MLFVGTSGWLGVRCDEDAMVGLSVVLITDFWVPGGDFANSWLGEVVAVNFVTVGNNSWLGFFFRFIMNEIIIINKIIMIKIRIHIQEKSVLFATFLVIVTIGFK